MYYLHVNEILVHALFAAVHRVQDRLETALAAVRLSPPKLAALNALAAAGEPVSLSDLAAKLTCVRSNVTQLVDRMEADGLVKRSDDPKDRRGVRAELTKLGRERHAEGSKVYAAVLAELAGNMPADVQASLQSALEGIS